MRIEVSQTANAPISDMWRVMGEEFGDIANVWSGVYFSEARPGIGVNGAPTASRVSYTNMGTHPTIETIQVYDPENYRISYDAKSESFPGFVKSLVNTWEFRRFDETQTAVHLRLEAELSFPFKLLMAPMMKQKFESMMPDLIEELAHYARTNQKHPRKIAFDESDEAEKARAKARLRSAV